MPATIKIKNSSTASAVPTSSDLVQGELAVNVTDKRIFTENASGTVVELGTNPSILTLPDGSASAPTLTNDGDTNTGIFFPAADTVGITTGGTERARVDSSGNLGLGVTPSAWGSGLKAVEVGGSNSYMAFNNTSASGYVYWNMWNDGTNNKTKQTGYIAAYGLNSSGGHVWFNGSGTTGATSSLTQAMTLDASGNLLVGGTTATNSASGRGNIVINGSSNAMLNLTVGNTQKGYLYHNNTDILLNNAANGAMLFYTNDTERARIDSSGNLLVGKTASDTSSSGVQIYNTSGTYGRINLVKSASGTVDALANYYSGTYVGGLTYSNTATAIVTSSDIRLKKDIVDAGSASTKIDQIRIVSHGWKHDDDVVEFGVIAQELNSVVPQAVVAGDAGEEIEKTWGVDYSKLIPILIKAHQELKAEFDAYKASHP